MTEPTSARRYFACKFRPEDSRSYTYHFDGAPFAVGDTFRIEDRSGDGWKKVLVVAVTDEKPPFPTKPILCLHVEDVPAAPSLAA